MEANSTASSEWRRPKARLLSYPDSKDLLSCGIDAGGLPHLEPKLNHRILLLKDVRLFAANILKQTMLSIGGDVAVHRSVISGRVDYSDCIMMGDLRHYRLLLEKLDSQPNMSEIAVEIRRKVFMTRGPDLELNLCSGLYRWEARPILMGIVNVTPDSFSDGGNCFDHEMAVDHAMKLVNDGADIIDVGGESTRPGATEISPEEEMRRVLTVIKGLASRTSRPISIDTRKAEVARAAIESGAVMINDVSAMTHDPHMLNLAKATGAGIVLMHMRGIPENMQKDTVYKNIVSEVYDYLEGRVNVCIEAGIDPSSIVVDPGIGFGKSLEGNLSLLKHVTEFSSLGVPVLIGHSRKTFIGRVLDSEVNDREEGTDAVTAWAAMSKVDIIRIHDARRARKVVDMINAIQEDR
jgi:dihydropteroate synthase